MNTTTLAKPLARPTDAGAVSPAPRCAPAWRAPLLTFALGMAACLLMPDQLGLLTRIFILGLLVLSLDLVVGVAGLATLGHSAVFGMGAYAAGIFALHVAPDPLIGLGIGLLAGAGLAALSGAFLLRYQGFTFLMLTVAVSQLVLSVAHKARDWTGGDDGLSGYVMGPLLGRFEFDLEGRVAAYYALGVLVLGFYVARRLVDSPFGLAVRGIHESRARMAALGTPVYRRLLAIYTVAGALAGVAGALSAQTTAVVGLDSLSFALSAEVLVMLILGGAGRLTGAIVGAAIFLVLHHTASSINPYHWLFIVGALLMLVVLVSPAKAMGWLRARLGGAPMSDLLELRHVDKRYGGLHVTRDVSLRLSAGDRLALIGPNGAGKTTLVHQISGVLGSDRGEVWLRGENVTRLSQAQRVRRGLARTFQITTLAPHLPVQRQIEMALFEREGLSGSFWRNVDSHPALSAEARELLERFGLGGHAATPTQDLAYGEQRLIEMALALALRPRVLLLDEPMAGVPKGDGARLLAALDALPRDLGVLLIEHDMDLVFRFASRILVLCEGAVLADGTPDEIRRSPAVRAAYLGN